MTSEQKELELVRELPSSSGRRVWEAVQHPLGRRIAYTRLAEGILPTSPRARALVDEVKAHALLNHPNIRHVYSFSITATDVLVEAEFAEGEPVVSYVKEHPEQLLSVLIQVAAALDYAHGRGVLHAGLDAESVQILEGNVVKIGGFRVVVGDSRATMTLTTPSDAALSCPEVREGSVVSALSDIYLLGALAYHLTTFEKLPVEGQPRTFKTVLSRHLSTGSVQKGLLELLDRCLAPIPADRPETMKDVLGELHRIQSLDRSSVSDRGFRPRSRARFFWSLAALVALCFVFVVVLIARDPPGETVQLTRVPVESSASQLARLRVVARPWARVFVDGIFQDTTPFAALLTVSPGQHWVRFEHPSAPPEERLIEVQSGQVAIVDVEMRVQVSPLPKGEIAPLVETTP